MSTKVLSYMSKNIFLILYPYGKNILKKINSYSCAHACLLMHELIGSWTSILVEKLINKYDWLNGNEDNKDAITLQRIGF
jgi:hypothetical protein